MLFELQRVNLESAQFQLNYTNDVNREMNQISQLCTVCKREKI